MLLMLLLLCPFASFLPTCPRGWSGHTHIPHERTTSSVAPRRTFTNKSWLQLLLLFRLRCVQRAVGRRRLRRTHANTNLPTLLCSHRRIHAPLPPAALRVSTTTDVPRPLERLYITASRWPLWLPCGPRTHSFTTVTANTQPDTTSTQTSCSVAEIG